MILQSRVFVNFNDEKDETDEKDQIDEFDEPTPGSSIAMTIRRYEDLKCWMAARELTQTVYRMTRAGGLASDFGLRNQMQRAAVSIMANIAEGFGRRADKEFTQFLYIAMGSSCEVQSHLYVALDEKYITRNQFDDAYEKVDKAGRMISSFIKYLRSGSSKEISRR